MKAPIHYLFLLLSYFFLSCESSDNSVTPTASESSSAGKGGSLARMAIVQNTLYFVDNSTIKVYDIANDKNPTLVNSVNISSSTIETIFSLGEYLYLGSSNGLFIYSIKDNKSPKYLSMATHASGCDPVVSDGKFAYVTVRNTISCNRWREFNALEIFNVENPTAPFIVSSTILDGPVGLAIDGDILFVCDATTLKILNVKNRSNPNIIKSIESDAFDIIIDGDNVLTVTSTGINQYAYDRENLTLTFRSHIKTSK